MDTEQNITLTAAYTDVVEHFGPEKAKALNRLTVLTVEAGHDRLVTESILHESEARLEGKIEGLRKELHSSERRLEGKIDDLRKDFDGKFWIMIGLMVTTLGGMIFVILGK